MRRELPLSRTRIYFIVFSEFLFFDADICYCVIALSSIIRSLAVDKSLVVIRFLYVLELSIILITYLLLFNFEFCDCDLILFDRTTGRFATYDTVVIIIITFAETIWDII